MAQNAYVYVKNQSEQTSATQSTQSEQNTSPVNNIPISNTSRTKQAISLGGGILIAKKVFNFGVSEMGSYGYDITQNNVQEGLKYVGLLGVAYLNPVIGSIALATTLGSSVYDKYRETKKDAEKQKNVNMLNGALATNNSLYGGGGTL